MIIAVLIVATITDLALAALMVAVSGFFSAPALKACMAAAWRSRPMPPG